MQQDQVVVCVVADVGRAPNTIARRARRLSGTLYVLAAVLALAAAPASAQPSGDPYANGCCVCRTLQADGRYADKSCTDGKSYTGCAQACQSIGSTTIVFSANATCAQGCGGAQGR